VDAQTDAYVYALSPHEAFLVKDKLGPLIKKGLRRGRSYSMTEESFWQAVNDGRYILWAVSDGHDITACIALEYYEDVGGKFLIVVMLAGHWSDKASQAVHENLRRTAKRMGIDHVETFTRKGMVARLKNAGWKEVSTVMKLEI
jgi:hypothetical protein